MAAASAPFSFSGGGASPSGDRAPSALAPEAVEAIEDARRAADRERREREDLSKKLAALQALVAAGGGGGGGGARRDSLPTPLLDEDAELSAARAREEVRRARAAAVREAAASRTKAAANALQIGQPADGDPDDIDEEEESGGAGVGVGASPGGVPPSASAASDLPFSPGGDAGGAAFTLNSPTGATALSKEARVRLVRRCRAKFGRETEAVRAELRELQEEFGTVREALTAQLRESVKAQSLLEALVAVFLAPREVAKVWDRAVLNEATDEWTLPRVRPRQGWMPRSTPAAGGKVKRAQLSRTGSVNAGGGGGSSGYVSYESDDDEDEGTGGGVVLDDDAPDLLDGARGGGFVSLPGLSQPLFAAATGGDAPPPLAAARVLGA